MTNPFFSIVGFHRESDPYGCFANEYIAPFDYAGKHFLSVNQFLMYHKALLISTAEKAEAILACEDPYEVLQLLPDEDETAQATWDSIKRTVCKRAIRAKFSQNEDILNVLLETQQSIIAYCSYLDDQWGIGVHFYDVKWRNIYNWKGKNELGTILMEVRDELASIQSSILPDDIAQEDSIPQWRTTAGILMRLPAYKDTIMVYANALPERVRESFFYDYTLEEIDHVIGGSDESIFPSLGFYEMKQDIYDITKMLEFSRAS